ncbi:MAG: replication-associated recombination protein A, partial [Fusobacteriaceae bacterium]
IGATTENPYYNLNNALISRVLIFEFKSLTEKDIRKILERGKKYLKLKNFPEEVENSIAELSAGDSRVALNYLELYNNCKDLETEEIINIFSERKRAFNKKEDKYNLISAMIKSIRGSDPNSAVYWMGRLLSGGEDPRYIARRFIISAAEDIGLANPEALNIASSALIASERIGMPEIRIILSEVAIYLAISSKSPSAYNAVNSALKDIEKGDCEEVPANINANPVGYKYPHDYPGSFVNQKYSNKKREYYIPAENRNEKMIKEKLEKLWNK